MTAWIVVTVVWKSWTSELIDTFITDWSSTMRNCAEAKATSASQPLLAPALFTLPALSLARSCPDGSESVGGPASSARPRRLPAIHERIPCRNVSKYGIWETAFGAESRDCGQSGDRIVLDGIVAGHRHFSQLLSWRCLVLWPAHRCYWSLQPHHLV